MPPFLMATSESPRAGPHVDCKVFPKKESRVARKIDKRPSLSSPVVTPGFFESTNCLILSAMMNPNNDSANEQAKLARSHEMKNMRAGARAAAAARAVAAAAAETVREEVAKDPENELVKAKARILELERKLAESDDKRQKVLAIFKTISNVVEKVCEAEQVA